MRQTKEIFRQYLVQANNKVSEDVSVFKIYKMVIQKEKLLYGHMNMLRQSGMILSGLVWAPTYYKFEKKIVDIISQKGLTGLNFEKGPSKIDGLDKPTLFRTNEFTDTFQ